ncbi:MAG: hypothetical protein AB8G86_04915 [Saprospiraceae bacterium]
MKNIPNNDLQFIKSINHQDKLFVFALKQETDKTYADIYYSVQDAKRDAENEAEVDHQLPEKGSAVKENHQITPDEQCRAVKFYFANF